MSSYSQMLTSQDIVKLKTIMSSLLADKLTGDIIRSGFAGYVKRTTGKAIKPWSLARIIHHPDQAPYARQALLYDYIQQKLAPLIIQHRFDGQCTDETVKKIKELIEDGRTRAPLAWDIEGLERFCAPVTKPYINEYFGYRMSANAGSVIRFYLDIQETDEPTKVAYRNLYRSGATSLEISGTGRFVHDTLYLVGHATDINGFETKGMRLMALRQLETSEKLSGIVLTAYGDIPIAARVLMVPTKMHMLNLSATGKISERDLKRFVMDGLNDRTILDAVKQMSNIALRDISSGRSTEDTLAMFIENTTPTVLKSGDTEDLGFDLPRLTDEMNLLRTTIPSGIGTDLGRALAENMASAIEAFRKKLGGLEEGGTT